MKKNKLPNPRHGQTFLDANCLDSRNTDFVDTIDDLIELARDRVSILLPYSVMQEISHRNTPPEVKERAAEFIFTIEVNLTGEEYVIFNQVHKILRGNSQAEKHRKDAFHLFEGYKYCGNYFITTDRRILKKGDLIYKLINIMPVDPDSYIDILKQFGILDNGQES